MQFLVYGTNQNPEEGPPPICHPSSQRLSPVETVQQPGLKSGKEM